MLFIVLTTSVSFVPVIGTLASTVIQVVMLAGLLDGCREVERGGRLTLNQLFVGFGSPLRPLLVLGLLLGIASLAVLLIVYAPIAAMMGLGFFGSALSEVPEWPENFPDDLDPSLAWVAFAVFLGAALLAVPVGMAGWFAPGLVMLRGLAPLDALKESFLGSLKNLWPLSVCGLLLAGLSVVALIPFGLGLPVILPIWVASVYAGLRDIYREDDGESTEPQQD
jgi:hypothetical protein